MRAIGSPVATEITKYNNDPTKQAPKKANCTSIAWK